MMKMRKPWQGLENDEKHVKTFKMRNKHCWTWKIGRNSEQREKLDMHTVGHGICREN